MNQSSNAFLVGLVLLSAMLVGAYFFVSSRKNTLSSVNSSEYYAYLTDASGINAKSLITVAGLQVGEIHSVTLTEARVADLSSDWDKSMDNPDKKIRVARVDMRIINDLKIPVDSWLKKESLGLLGAKALFLELGSSTELFEPGDRLENVRSETGLETLQNRMEGMVGNVESIIAKVDANIEGIVSDIKGITGTLNAFISGDEDHMPINELYEMVMGEVKKTIVTVEKTVRDVNSVIIKNDDAVSGLLANLQRISDDVAEITAPAYSDGGTQGGGELRETVASVHQITADLSVVTSSLKNLVGENESEVGAQVDKLKTTLNELNRSLASLSEITGRVERGEGTVGRLLTDERMADKLEDAVVGASDFVSDLTALETHIDLGTWYSVRRGNANVSFGIKLQPKPDKFYFFEVVDDGGGVEKITQVIEGVQQTPVGTAEVTREATYVDDNTIRITAMFAKKFYDFLILRAGIMESSGGVGADLVFFDNRLQLRTDIYNWGGPRNRIQDPDLFYPGFTLPRWRTMMKAQPIPYAYLMLGVDDVLNTFDLNYGSERFGQIRNPSFHGYGFDFFFGVGISFKDDDLRNILPFIPSL